MLPVELIYEEDEDGEIHWLFRNEANIMRAAGLSVRTRPSLGAARLLRRGCIVDEENFPSDPRYLQDAATYGNYLYIARWYPVIKDLTIPTIFCGNLGHEAATAIKANGWSRAFVKNSVKSLVEENPLESVWPNVSFEELHSAFSRNPRKGSYALRQYLPPETFEDERRYWVIGNKIHHSSGKIPAIVEEATTLLSSLGGIFYTIDATPALVVEVNAGESSDRKTDNLAEDFARWTREAFQ